MNNMQLQNIIITAISIITEPFCQIKLYIYNKYKLKKLMFTYDYIYNYQ